MNEELIKRAVGYFVLKSDIPSQGLFAGDQIYFDSDPQTTARLVVGVWDDNAHLCQFSPIGTLWSHCCNAEAPPHATVFGGALYVSRAIPGYKEAAE